MIKKIFIYLLNKLSRVIYHLTPQEFIAKSPMEIKLKENLTEETFKYFKEHYKKSMIFGDDWELRKYAIKTSLLNDRNKEYFYLEFGTFKGTTATFFSKFINKLYCFDSFEGLKEDWAGTKLPKGFFNLNKKAPKLPSNVETVVGWVEDTLDNFLKEHNPKVNFVHLDMDTYSPTKFALKKLKPYLVKNCIILFDELNNYNGWEHGEFKALKEVFQDSEFEYKAFNINKGRVVIQII